MDEKIVRKFQALLRANPEEYINAFFETPFWPTTLEPRSSYSRFEHDSREGQLVVGFSEDGDGWIELLTKLDRREFNMSLRFRMPMIGGGESERTRNALLLLAEAIRQDNEEWPQKRGSAERVY